MAVDFMQTILTGRLGKDVEGRKAGETTISNVRLASSYRTKEKGQWVDKTEWTSVVFFGKLAETVQTYLKKGSRILVSGQLQTREWVDQSGQKRYTPELFADKMVILESPKGNQGATYQDEGDVAPAKKQAAADNFFDEDFDEDPPVGVPF